VSRRRTVFTAPRASRVLAATLVLGAAALVAACSSASAGTTGTTGGNLACRPSGGTEAYPAETGCGTEAGDIIADYSFQGRAAGATSPRGAIKLSDYYDPAGSKGLRYLVVDVSAFWCSYCKEEAPQLASLDAKYKARGVVWLTVVAQDGSRGVATDTDVDAWIKAYALVTPAVSDPGQNLTSFFDPNQMPLNMIVDLKTMKIVAKITGSGLQQVQTQLDAKLAGAT
jgi:thiol-disulfide isomerase/thioredoxin